MWPGRAIRGKGFTLEGNGGERPWLFQGSRAVAPPVSVKDHIILAPMASLELCTDRMSCFMGLGKPSSFCNYLVEQHIPASCCAFTFGGRMRLRDKTSSQEQGLNFDLVETWERLSYVRTSGSQLYGILVRFFPPHGVYRFESPWHSQIWVAGCRYSHLIVCLVYCWWIRAVGYGYGYDYIIIMIMIIVFTYLSCWHGSMFCLFMLVLVRRCKHSTWLNLKWLKQ
jgi:hypothetical protein